MPTPACVRDHVELVTIYLVETLKMLHQDELLTCSDLVQGHHMTFGQPSVLAGKH